MKKINFTYLLFVLCFTSKIIIAQSPSWDWAKTAGGSDYDRSNSLAIDDDGNVYMAGSFGSASITFDTVTLVSNSASSMYLVKYDSFGNVIWARTNSTGVIDAEAVATDDSGNVYVTGFFAGTISFGTNIITSVASSEDIYLVKYSSVGNVLWIRQCGGSQLDNGTGLATDNAGYIYLTGNFVSDSIIIQTTTLVNAGIGTNDIVLAKYNGSGNLIWAKQIGGYSYDHATGISVNNRGNIFITGESKEGPMLFDTISVIALGYWDIFLAKYDSAGNAQWARCVGGYNQDAGTSVVTDDSENVYIAGYYGSDTIWFGTIYISNIQINAADLYIAKYDSSGTPLWVQSAYISSTATATALTIDPMGNIYMAGVLYDTLIIDTVTLLSTGGGGADLYIAKCTPGGSFMWAKETGGSDDDTPYSLTSDAAGNIYVTGGFYSPSIPFGSVSFINNGSSTTDAFIAKLDTLTITETEKVSKQNSGFNIYPNPSNNNFTIDLKNLFDKIDMSITTLTGQLIYTTTSKGNKKIEVNTKNFVEGIYLVTIQSPNYIESKKLIISK